MTDPGRDAEFEAYLRRRSVLGGRGPVTEKLEPPDDLDAIVLRKARQAIHAPAQLPLYRAPRWALPVALAATILLCVSVVLNVSLNTRRSSGDPKSVTVTATRQEAVPQAPPSQMESITQNSSPEPTVPRYARSDVAARATGLPEVEIDPRRRLKAQAPVLAAPAPMVAAPPPEARNDAKSDAGRVSIPPSSPPEAWLKRIDALRAQGKTLQAEDELHRFRTAFPDYPVLTTPSGPPK